MWKLAMLLSLAMHAQDFSGVFSGDGLTLRLEGPPAALTGVAESGGDRFPVRGTSSGGQFNGSYTEDGAPIPFTATLSGDTMEIRAAGRIYRLTRQPAAGSPNLFREPAAGFAMPLEGGFQLARREESAVLFTSATLPGLLLVKAGEQFTAAEIEAALKSGYQAEGVDLKPVSPPETLGGHRAALVAGQLNGNSAKGLLAGLIGPTGECFVVLAATTPEQWPKLEPAARRMLSGIQLSAPQAPPAPSHDKQLFDYLSGARLRYRESIRSTGSTGRIDGSFSSRDDIYLCGDGTFSRDERSSASVSGAGSTTYSSSNPNQSGRWTASVPPGGAPQLILQFNSGRTVRHVLRPDGRRVFLDGYGYERIQGQGCQR
jgi:hypothetical protein